MLTALPGRRIVAAVLALLSVLGGSAAIAREGEQAVEGRRESRYTIQVLVRPTLAAARREARIVVERLGAGAGARIEPRAPGFSVCVGDFATVDHARQLLERVLALGYENASLTPVVPDRKEPDLDGSVLRSDAERPRGTVTEGVGNPAETTAAAKTQTPAVVSKELPGSQIQGKRIRAMRITDGVLTIDGRLDETTWSSAPFSSDFQKKGARRGFPSPEKTEIAVLYDDDALYVGARVHLRDRRDIRTRTSQRDDAADADRIIVSLDTLHNRQTAYNFGVTAGGTRIDYYQPEDAFEVRDYTFDPVWRARSALDDGGWTAEMRIPFSSLRFHGGTDSQVWGINVQRVSPALRLYSFWVVVPGDETGWSSRFGDLVGLDGVHPARRLALIPYVAGQSVRADEQSPDDPFTSSGAIDARYGADFVADVTPGLSFEATINPDFGQIEADPAVINLSAYEVFFPEKRPFFLEGAELFRGLGPRYYYSRRIGAPPHGRVHLPFQDLPVDTTIQGAAKLIGRQSGGLSVATLVALTAEEQAQTFDPDTSEFGRVPVEPQTTFAVARLQKDFGAGSTFGFVGTGVRREFPSSGSLETLLAGEAYTGGVDWNLRFAGQSHVFGGFLGASRVEGDPTAILRLQRASARYLQRPDADYVEVDSTRTTLEGYTAGLHLGRIKGAWRWVLSGEARSPEFEINDAGAMATADDLSAYGQVSYHTRAFGPWHRVDLSTSVASGWNFGGIRQYTIPAAEVHLYWRNFWQTYVEVARDLRSLSDSLTRGGPLMETADGWRSKFGFSSNDARLWVWALDGSYSTDELGGRGYGVSTRARIRFADRFTFAVVPGYQRALGTRQYYATLPGDRPETFERRYVFATLDQHTVYARLRLGLAITSRLGFDLYVEPFAATGSYDRFGELAAAGGGDLRLYGTDGTTITRLEDGSYVVTDGDSTFPLADGDFDLTSLRGNAVLRWDYAQGSTLYFVWAQTRDAEDVLGGPVRPGDLVDVFDAPARNVFAIKASFRLGLH